MQALFGAGHADVAKAALLFERRPVERTRMGEEAFFHAGEKDEGELEALCVVGGEEGDLGARVDAIGIGNERGMVEKIGEALESLGGFGGGVDQLVEVLETRSAPGSLSSFSMSR